MQNTVEQIEKAYDLLSEFTTPKARFPLYFLHIFRDDADVYAALEDKTIITGDERKMQYVMEYYAQKCDEFEAKVTALAIALGCSAYNLFFAAISDKDYIEDLEKTSVSSLGNLDGSLGAELICKNAGLREITTKKTLDEIRRMKLED